MSNVARSCAILSGACHGTMVQATPTLTRLVLAAMAASRLWGELMMLCSLKACSAIQTESNPSSSANSAPRRMSS